MRTTATTAAAHSVSLCAAFTDLEAVEGLDSLQQLHTSVTARTRAHTDQQRQSGSANRPSPPRAAVCTVYCALCAVHCSLRLSHNGLRELGRSLSLLRSLRRLFVDANLLTRLDGASLPCALIALDASANGIHRLGGLGALTALRSVDLSANALEALDVDDGGLTALPALESLQLSRNRLSSLSSLRPLTALRRLRALSLSSALHGPNPACALPHCATFVLSHLPQLSQLDGRTVHPAEVGHATAVWRQKAAHYARQRRTSRRVLADALRALAQLRLARTREVEDERREHAVARAALVAAQQQPLCAAREPSERSQEAAMGAGLAEALSASLRALSACNAELHALRCAFDVSVAALKERQREVEWAMDAEMDSGGHCRWEESDAALSDAVAALRAAVGVCGCGRGGDRGLIVRRAVRWGDEERRRRWEQRFDDDDGGSDRTERSAEPQLCSGHWFATLSADAFSARTDLNAAALSRTLWPPPLAASAQTAQPLSLSTALPVALSDAPPGDDVLVLIGRLHVPREQRADCQGCAAASRGSPSEDTAVPVRLQRIRGTDETDVRARESRSALVEEAKASQLSLDDSEVRDAQQRRTAGSAPAVFEAQCTDRSAFLPDLVAVIRVERADKVTDEAVSAASALLPAFALRATAHCVALREPLLDAFRLADAGRHAQRRRRAAVDGALTRLAELRSACGYGPTTAAVLDLSAVGLLSLPPLCASLTALHLAGNALTSLDLPALPQLTALDVSHNLLPAAPFTAALFARIPLLEHLHAQGNPLQQQQQQQWDSASCTHPLLACLLPCAERLLSVSWGLYEAAPARDGADRKELMAADGFSAPSLCADADAAPSRALLDAASASFRAAAADALRLLPRLSSFDGLTLRPCASSSSWLLHGAFAWLAPLTSPLHPAAASASSTLTAALLFQCSLVRARTAQRTAPVAPGEADGVTAATAGGRVTASEMFPDTDSQWKAHVAEVELDHLGLTSLLPAFSSGSAEGAEPLTAFASLTALSLNGNRLSTFERITARPLALLQDVSAEDNALSDVTLLAQQCPNLVRLDLSRNRLQQLGAQPLSALRFLRVLHVECNRLTSLDGLEGCCALEELHAQHNPLSDARSVRALMGLPRLAVLDVSASPLHASAGHRAFALFALPALAVLDGRRVDANERRAAMAAHDGRLTVDALTTAVGHSAFALLERLNLSHQGLRSVDCLTAQRLPHLRLLVLDHNDLDGVPHLRPLPRLRALHLNHNRIAQLHTRAEARAWRRQQQRAIGERGGDSDDDEGGAAGAGHLGACFPALEVLELAHNAITSMAALSLEGLRRLRVLQLAGNAIERLNAPLAQVCPELRALCMAQCGLRRIDRAALDGCERLEALQLEDNDLRGLPQLALPGLRSLLLSANRFAEMADVDAALNADYLPALTRLSLAHTPLSRRPLYRTHLLRLLLQCPLSVLDGASVTEDERRRCAELNAAQPQAPSGTLIRFAADDSAAAASAISRGAVTPTPPLPLCPRAVAATSAVFTAWPGAAAAAPPPAAALEWGLQGRAVVSRTSLAPNPPTPSAFSSQLDRFSEQSHRPQYDSAGWAVSASRSR